MSLLPNLTNSGPGKSLYAPAAGGGGGGVPADLVVSTLTVEETLIVNGQTTFNSASSANPFTFVQISSDLATTEYNVNLDMRTRDDGACFLSQGVTPEPLQPFSVVTTLATDVRQGELNFAGPSTTTGGGQATATRYVLRGDLVASTFSMIDVAFDSGIVMSEGTIQIVTPLTTGIKLNGAVPPGEIFDTRSSTWPGTTRLAPGGIQEMTLEFTTNVNHEYRVSWTDQITVIEGTPAANDTCYYEVNNTLFVDQYSLPLASTLGKVIDGTLQGPNLSHNFTFVATQPTQVMSFINDTATCSTIIQLTQDFIRIQDLGPLLEYPTGELGPGNRRSVLNP